MEKSQVLRAFLCAVLTTALLGVSASAIGQPSVQAAQKLLTPGESFDITSLSKNTDVIINKPGSYTLSGKSNYACVYIKSGDVKLYLADGLNIDPDTNNGLIASAAITIEDQGGHRYLDFKGKRKHLSVKLSK